MNIRQLRITTLTLLAITVSIAGTALLYLPTRSLQEIPLALGIALLEIGLISILYEHVILKIEKGGDDEEEIEKLEGRPRVTEKMRIKLNIANGVLEVQEEEDIRFVKTIRYSPLIYLDALEIKGYEVNGKPRVEAYLETHQRHTLIGPTDNEKYCTIDANAYNCKNPASIEVKKGTRAKLITIRRYALNEITRDPSTVTYNRQLWYPTYAIEVAIPTQLEKTYDTKITIKDYNGDIKDITLHRTQDGGYIVYRPVLSTKNPGRYFIMDKVVITLWRKKRS